MFQLHIAGKLERDVRSRPHWSGRRVGCRATQASPCARQQIAGQTKRPPEGSLYSRWLGKRLISLRKEKGLFHLRKDRDNPSLRPAFPNRLNRAKNSRPVQSQRCCPSNILGAATALGFDGAAGFDCLHDVTSSVQPTNINQTLTKRLVGPPQLYRPGERPAASTTAAIFSTVVGLNRNHGKT